MLKKRRFTSIGIAQRPRLVLLLCGDDARILVVVVAVILLVLLRLFSTARKITAIQPLALNWSWSTLAFS